MLSSKTGKSKLSREACVQTLSLAMVENKGYPKLKDTEAKKKEAQSRKRGVLPAFDIQAFLLRFVQQVLSHS